jgi:site-specific recombinase XerD
MPEATTVCTPVETNRFDAFAVALTEQGRARKTIDSYRSDWLGIARWHALAHQSPFDLSLLTAPALAAFRDACVAEGLRPSTINRKLVAAKRYVDWAVRAGTLAVDHHCAVREVAPVPQPRRRPRGLTGEELNLFLRAVEVRATARDQAIVHVLLESGLKVSELVALEREDVTISTRRAVIQVVRHGQLRKLAMGRPARRKLRRYLNERGEHPGALFEGERGPLTTNGVQRLVRKYCRYAEVRVSPSTLRHTFANGFLKASRGDLLALADLLGHECVETTRLYMQTARERIAGRGLEPMAVAS